MTELAALVDHALAGAEPAISAGLSKEQVAWALASYRAVVLPPRLSAAAERDDVTAQRWADRAADELRGRLEALDAKTRWRVIVADYYGAKLAPLSDAAFALAQLAHTGEDVAERARRVRADLDVLRAEIDASSPGTLDDLAEELADSVLDLEFVLEGPELCSLRMGRWLRTLEAPR